MHKGPARTALYRRFDSSWRLGSTWTGVAEAEIASDGTGEVFLALRSTSDRLALSRQDHPWGATWYPVVNEHGGPDPGSWTR